jgi:hypothetical protein
MVDDGASLDGRCQTHQVRLLGAHGYSKTLFINLIQHFGLETDVAKHLADAYGDRAWTVAALSAATHRRWPVRGERLTPMYPFTDGEVRYGVRHEYAQTAVDVLARRTRLAFLNAQACLEALPRVIDLMAAELGWDRARQDAEWRDTLAFLASMGLPKSRLGLSRQDVESGKAGQFLDDEEYRMYSRHGMSGSPACEEFLISFCCSTCIMCVCIYARVCYASRYLFSFPSFLLSSPLLPFPVWHLQFSISLFWSIFIHKSDLSLSLSPLSLHLSYYY